MENKSNHKIEKNVHKNPNTFVPSENLTDLKKKLSLPFRLHSLICECVIFISIGSIIAISGNFATIVFYKQSTSPESSNFSKEITYDEKKANHSSDLEFHQNDDNVTYSRKNVSRNTKNEEKDNICYENATIWLETLDDVRFAVETIALPSVATLGVMGNILVIITLIKLTKSKKENKNQTNFDRLLIFLSATDTLFLIMHIIDAIIQAQNHSEPMWYQNIYPNIWHPMKNILTTASQYMVVAVTIERYVVICHKTVTIMKHKYYSLIVIVFCVIVNVPKFFEFEKVNPIMDISENSNSTSQNFTETTNNDESVNAMFLYKISSLGENRNWYLFNAVHEIFIIGFCLLVISYCNYRVWLQVIKSAIHKKNRHIGGSNTRENPLRSSVESSKIKNRAAKKTIYRSMGCSHVLIKDRDKHSFRNSIRSEHQTGSFIHNESKKAYLNSSKVSNKILANLQDNIKPKHNGMQKSKTSLHSKGFLDQETSNSPSNQRRDEKADNNQNDEQKIRKRSVSDSHINEHCRKFDCGKNTESLQYFQQTMLCKQNSSISKRNTKPISKKDNLFAPAEAPADPVSDSKIECNGRGEVSVELLPRSNSENKDNGNLIKKRQLGTTENRIRTNNFASTKSKKFNASIHHFRKVQRSSSGVLIGIVLIFLFCNFPRFVVKTFIISTHGNGLEEQFLFCDRRDQLHVPAFVHIIGMVNHLLLVLNSSTNFLIQCCVAKRFRKTLRKILRL